MSKIAMDAPPSTWPVCTDTQQCWIYSCRQAPAEPYGTRMESLLLRDKTVKNQF